MAITNFKDMVAQDVEGIFLNDTEHAVLGNYIPKVGVTTTDTPMIIDISEHREKIDEHQRKVALVDVGLADIGVNPGVNDKIEIDSITWDVVDVLSIDDGVAVLEVESDVRPDFPAAEYTRR